MSTRLTEGGAWRGSRRYRWIGQAGATAVIAGRPVPVEPGDVIDAADADTRSATGVEFPAELWEPTDDEPTTSPATTVPYVDDGYGRLERDPIWNTGIMLDEYVLMAVASASKREPIDWHASLEEWQSKSKRSPMDFAAIANDLLATNGPPPPRLRDVDVVLAAPRPGPRPGVLAAA